MKLKKNFLTTGIALLVTLLFASCSQDETLPGNSAGSMPALGLSTLQATDIDVSKAATRTVTTTDYPTANSIGFFVKADAATNTSKNLAVTLEHVYTRHLDERPHPDAYRGREKDAGESSQRQVYGQQARRYRP